MISNTQLKQIMPTLQRARRALLLPLLRAAMTEFEIATRLRAASFLAQVGHESADLKYFEELATGDAYDTRTDLGNTPRRDGDGRRYKGRGPLQTTGKRNYRAAGEALGLPLLVEPELLAEPEHGFRAAAYFWSKNGCNELADKLTGRGDMRDLKQFDRITRRINGGDNGRIDRRQRYIIALRTLNEEQFKTGGAVEVQPSPEGEVTITPAALAPPCDHLAATDSTIAAVGTAGDRSLTGELEALKFDRAQTSEVCRSVARRLWIRLARPAAIVWAALEAGHVWAWAGVIILAVGALGMIYWHRRDLRRAGAWVIRKFNGE